MDCITLNDPFSPSGPNLESKAQKNPKANITDAQTVVIINIPIFLKNNISGTNKNIYQNLKNVGLFKNLNKHN